MVGGLIYIKFATRRCYVESGAQDQCTFRGCRIPLLLSIRTKHLDHFASSRCIPHNINRQNSTCTCLCKHIQRLTFANYKVLIGSQDRGHKCSASASGFIILKDARKIIQACFKRAGVGKGNSTLPHPYRATAKKWATSKKR